MQVRQPLAQVVGSVTGGLRVPVLARIGGVVIAIGLGFDLVAHTVLHSIHDELVGAFPLQEHFAHLVVVVGMVLVLAGVIADGLRMQRRLARQEGTTRNAVR